jgi:hypothetical protein
MIVWSIFAVARRANGRLPPTSPKSHHPSKPIRFEFFENSKMTLQLVVVAEVVVAASLATGGATCCIQLGHDGAAGVLQLQARIQSDMGQVSE